MSAEPTRAELVKQLERDPAAVVREHKDVALDLAERVRNEGKYELADAIEARVRMVEEGRL